MDIPYTVTARPDTGLWNAKIAIWLFLASEVMLFGGLFSAYIFLRMASDTPWPTHVLNVKAGFINTLILIFSSITVLQAWLSLKMRKYGRYQIYMAITIISAAVFMWIKFTEYGDKFHHYGVRLQDGSILEGHMVKGSYNVDFTAKDITLTARRNMVGIGGLTLPFVTPGSDGDFLSFLPKDTKAVVKDADGNEITLSGSEIQRLLNDGVEKAKAQEADLNEKAIAAAKERAQQTGLHYIAPEPVPQQEVTVKLTLTAPVMFSIKPSKLVSYDNGTATLRDGTILGGTLTDDTLQLRVDKIDVRRLLPSGEVDLKTAEASVENSDAWRILKGDWKEKFEAHRKEETEKYFGEITTQKQVLSPDFQREAYTMELSEEASEPAKAPGSDKAEMPSPKTDAPVAASSSGEPEVSIPKKDIAFYSNFTPKYHNYFAIYYALTSLHGLHIIGGAIVLGYFLLFGRKMYEQNPEHLANRVEVGGLFWHFVDVVWMFLFPVLYLF